MTGSQPSMLPAQNPEQHGTPPISAAGEDIIEAAQDEEAADLGDADLPFFADEIGFEAETYLPALFSAENVARWSRAEIDARLSLQLTTEALRSRGFEVADSLPSYVLSTGDSEQTSGLRKNVSLLELGIYLLRCRSIISSGSSARIHQSELDKEKIAFTASATKSEQRHRSDVIIEIDHNLHTLNRIIVDVLTAKDLPEFPSLRELETSRADVTRDLEEMHLIDPENIPAIKLAFERWRTHPSNPLASEPPVEGTIVNMHHFTLYLQYCHAYLGAQSAQGIEQVGRREAKAHNLIQVTDNSLIEVERETIKALLTDSNAFVENKLAQTEGSTTTDAEKTTRRSKASGGFSFPEEFTLSQLRAAGFDLSDALLQTATAPEPGKISYTPEELLAIAQTNLPRSETLRAQCLAFTLARQILKDEYENNRDALRVPLTGSGAAWMDLRPFLATFVGRFLAPFQGDGPHETPNSAPLWAVRAYFKYCVAATGNWQKDQDSQYIPLTRLGYLNISHPSMNEKGRSIAVRGDVRYRALRGLFAAERLVFESTEASETENIAVQSFILQNFYDPRLANLKAYGFDFFREIQNVPEKVTEDARAAEGRGSRIAEYLTAGLQKNSKAAPHPSQPALEAFLHGTSLVSAPSRAEPLPRPTNASQSGPTFGAPPREELGAVLGLKFEEAELAFYSPAQLTVRYTMEELRSSKLSCSNRLCESVAKAFGEEIATQPAAISLPMLVKYYLHCNDVIRSQNSHETARSVLEKYNLDYSGLDGELQAFRRVEVRTELSSNLRLMQRILHGKQKLEAKEKLSVRERFGTEPIRLARLVLDPAHPLARTLSAAEMAECRLSISSQIEQKLERVFDPKIEGPQRYALGDLLSYFDACAALWERSRKIPAPRDVLDRLDSDSALLDRLGDHFSMRQLRQEVSANIQILNALARGDAQHDDPFLDKREDAAAPGMELRSSAHQARLIAQAFGREPSVAPTNAELYRYYTHCQSVLAAYGMYEVSKARLLAGNMDYSGLDTGADAFLRRDVARELRFNSRRLAGSPPDRNGSTGDLPALNVDLEQIKPLKLEAADKFRYHDRAVDPFGPHSLAELRGAGLKTSLGIEATLDRILGTSAHEGGGRSLDEMRRYYQAAHSDVASTTTHRVRREYLERRGIDFSGLDSAETEFNRVAVRTELSTNDIRITGLLYPRPDRPSVEVTAYKPKSVEISGALAGIRIPTTLAGTRFSIEALREAGLTVSDKICEFVARAGGAADNPNSVTFTDVVAYHHSAFRTLADMYQRKIPRALLAEAGVDCIGTEPRVRKVAVRETLERNLKVLGKMLRQYEEPASVEPPPKAAPEITREQRWAAFKDVFRGDPAGGEYSGRSVALLRVLYDAGELQELGLSTSPQLPEAVSRLARLPRMDLSRLSLLDLAHYYVEGADRLQDDPKDMLHREDLQRAGIDFSGLREKRQVFSRSDVRAEYDANLARLAQLVEITLRRELPADARPPKAMTRNSIQALGIGITPEFWARFSAWKNLALMTGGVQVGKDLPRTLTGEVVLYFEHVLAFSRCQTDSGTRHFSVEQLNLHSIQPPASAIHKSKGFVYPGRLELWARRNIEILSA